MGDEQCHGMFEVVQLLRETERQLLRTVAISCGAAVEGSPRRQPWVAVLAIGAAKRRKENLFGRNSVAPDGTLSDGAFFPTAHAVGYLLPPHRG